MRQPDYSSQFKRDVKQAQKRRKDMGKMKALLGLLIDGKPLPTSYLDHPLKGGWRGFRDAHIEPDIFEKHDDVLLICVLAIGARGGIYQ